MLVGNGNKDEKIDNKHFDLLDYHWEDENKIEEDIKKIKKIYEAIIPKLSQILNEINGRNYSGILGITIYSDLSFTSEFI